MVEKHIKSLLYNHDCVIIPDFGGLITRYVPARINSTKHTLLPPSKKVAFNEKLVLNDGLLISSIAHADSISKEEARQLVMNFVHQARTRLNGENRFELEGIGVFRYNFERKLEFEYVESDNLLDSSFGLPELMIRPLRREEPEVLRTLRRERHAEPEVVKQPLRKRLKRAYNMAAGLALTGLIGAGFYMLSLQADYTISSLSPISIFGAERQAEANQNMQDYSADYMPFTEEERAMAYAAVMPGTSPVAEANAEELTLETTAEAGIASETLEGETQYAAGEDVSTEAESPATEVQPTVVSGKDGRFYIITGGYARMDNAEISRQEIAEQGHQAKVLEPGPGSRLFRVSVADFASAEEAQAAMNTYRKSFGETIWVFNN